MKTRLYSCLLGVTLVLTTLTAAAQSPSFTYQGFLTDQGANANGVYDLRFTLFDAPDAGTALVVPLPATNPIVVSDFTIRNGLFTIRLNFGATPFKGADVFLEVAVRPGASTGAFTPVTPRQKFTPTPYAVHAVEAKSLTGPVKADQLTGTYTSAVNFNNPANRFTGNGAGLTGVPVSGLAAGTYPNALTFPNAANRFTGNGSGLTLLNASAIGSGTVPDARLGPGLARLGASQAFTGANTFAGPSTFNFPVTFNSSITIPNSAATLNFGNEIRQMINLFETRYGIGVQRFTEYFRSHRNFAWFTGGTHMGADFDPGINGSVAMVLAEGQLGLGTIDPQFRLHVNGDSFIKGALHLEPIGVEDTGSGKVGYARIKGVSSSPDASIGIILATHVRDSLDEDGVLIEPDGSVSIGGINSQATLSVGPLRTLPKATLHVEGPYYGRGTMTLHADTGDENSGVAFIHAGDDTETTSVGLTLTTQEFGETKDAIIISADGTVTIPKLVSSVGAGVAERFQITTKEVPKGSVLVIDDEHPGELKLSDRAYDTRVAGINKGVNGANPGLILSQQGVAAGGQDVALSGRVYALADASSGPIRPGDLLTTSAVPGHAMKVTDSARALGAIIGKAMSPLEQGRGMILVLVSLQ